jgi:hypothetical protein
MHADDTTRRGEKFEKQTTCRDLGADGREVLIWIWGLDQPGSEQGAWLALNMVLNLRRIASLSFSRRALLQTVEPESIGTTHCWNYVYREWIRPTKQCGTTTVIKWQ